ncbi:MAG: hypothetical protein IPF72_01930 [Chitinophagaceae bacterium]|nr:hypothetical protein [Chitinophagaceae bacterium]
MEEVVVSVNKWEQKLNEVPNKISKVNKIEILRNNPQTAPICLPKPELFLFKKVNWVAEVL